LSVVQREMDILMDGQLHYSALKQLLVDYFLSILLLDFYLLKEKWWVLERLLCLRWGLGCSLASIIRAVWLRILILATVLIRLQTQFSTFVFLSRCTSHEYPHSSSGNFKTLSKFSTQNWIISIISSPHCVWWRSNAVFTHNQYIHTVKRSFTQGRPTTETLLLCTSKYLHIKSKHYNSCNCSPILCIQFSALYSVQCYAHK